MNKQTSSFKYPDLPRFHLYLLFLSGLLTFLLPACASSRSQLLLFTDNEDQVAQTSDALRPTPLPTRPVYAPGELVEYTAQTGDTMPALAAHFNTSIAEIFEANPIIPNDVTTLPPGMPMKIPIYYEPLWGSPYQIIPDSLFVNGPAQIGFDPIAYVSSQPGWLKTYEEYSGAKQRRGGEWIGYIATNFSISPRLLLAIIEYQTGAVIQAERSEEDELYPLGYHSYAHEGIYRQAVWAANILNNGYYGWRTGKLRSFEHLDGRLERPDPWQNAASVAIQYYFAQVLSKDDYEHAVSGEGLAKTYLNMFGDPWENVEAHIPGSLQQPAMHFPFPEGASWTYTGGPHTGWGSGEPHAAIDFAPPGVVGGCQPTDEWSTAIADGVVVRDDPAVAVLDLDLDGDERTGWNVFYLHLASEGKAPVGATLSAGQNIGKPSCEGGRSTGTHVHIARKYNGEWIPASGPLAFNLEGWVTEEGRNPYEGYLTRFSRRVRACVCSDIESQVTSGVR